MNKTNILNRVFTRNTFRQFVECKMDSIVCTVVQQYVKNPELKTNEKVLSEIYSILGKKYRNEYYYKNTLLRKLLLGGHCINTTTALTEIPIGKSKADFILINGKAVVYEIKTELDNLERLESQIMDYYSVFDHVSVVTYEENVYSLNKVLEKIRKPVGVYVLQQRGTIKEVISPEKYTQELNKDTIFRMLRKSEYENILLEYYSELPRVSDFKYYLACMDMFKKIPLEKSYGFVLKQLRNRNHVEKRLLDTVPKELKFWAYFMQINEAECKELQFFLNDLYGGV